MFIRCAFFRGVVRDGQREAFAAFVREKLVPLWTRFPGAQEVRVLRQVESDTSDPHLEMVLAIRYPDRAAIEAAMASSERFESRAVTQELLKMFDGTVFHTLFDAADYPLPTD